MAISCGGKKHRYNNKGEQKSKPKKTDKQTGTTVGRTDFWAMDFSLRKLAYIFNTRLKRLETLERRLKNFETLFRTSDLEFVVGDLPGNQNERQRE